MAQVWWTCAKLAVDTHSVIAMRVMGMNGTWSVPQSEGRSMLQEKAPAFTEAMIAGALTALSGRQPERVMQAAIEPISKQASANRARLARCGPRLFGQDLQRQHGNFGARGK